MSGSLSQRVCAGALAGILALGCAGAGSSQAPLPSGRELAADPRAAPAGPADGGTPGADAEAVVNEALQVVAKVRELPPRGKVRGVVITREEMLARVKKEIQSDVPADVMQASAELLFALGTVEESFDYEASVLKLMQAQLLGFYDPKLKTMFIGGDVGASMEDATLYHELVHALQDQHYDLATLLKFAPDRGDFLSALHALAEGDATSAMMDAMFAERGIRAIDLPESLLDFQTMMGQAFAGVEGVPSIITRSLLAPYFDGLTFTHFLRKKAGWAEVDRAWRNLPASTEQVLHPAKFLAREAPEVIDIPDAPPGFGTKVWYHDVMGEQSLRILFEEWMPARSASTSASDWAGDRIAVFREGERRVVAWRLRFDTELATARALAAFGRGALLPEGVPAVRKPETVTVEAAERAVKPGQLCRARHSRGPFAVAKRGRDLVVVLGPYLRNSGGVRADGDCVSANQWAQKLLAVRP